MPRTIDLTAVTPYADHLGDGLVQMSFTLPVPYSLAARKALLPLPTDPDREQGVLDAMAYSARVGLPTNVDLGEFIEPGTREQKDSFMAETLASGDPFKMYDPFLKLHGEGKLTTRLRIYFLSMDQGTDFPRARERVLNQFDRFGDETRLIGVGDEGLSFRHRAKRASARADFAEDHERGGAGAPAFEDVRAARFLANCVEREVIDQLRDGELVEISRNANLEPRRSNAGALVHHSRSCKRSSASRSSVQRIFAYASSNVNHPNSSCSSASIRMAASLCSLAAKPISVAMIGAAYFASR